MMKKEEPLPDVGVIVGRFQTNDLHQAHIDLIQHVCDNHKKVAIFLGLSPARVTRNNPLDFEARKQMILQKFPNVIVLYIKDQPSDELWSKNLDKQIADVVCGPGQSVILYGSRDSFISHYHGKHQTLELMQVSYMSATAIRQAISKAVQDTPQFRAGVIWAAFGQYPKVFPTVDVAIFNEDKTKLLMARKAEETQYRFIGGFAEPNSDSYEQDARREVQEEAGIEVGDMDYVGSFHIDDWRYSQEVDKIKTTFFMTKIIMGRPEAGDDICEVKWFNLTDIRLDDIVPNHKKLMKALIEKLGDKKLLKKIVGTVDKDDVIYTQV